MKLFVFGKHKVILLILLLLVIIPLLTASVFIIKPKSNDSNDANKLKAEKINSEIKSVISKNPKTVDPSGKEGPTYQAYLNMWKYCQTGDPNYDGNVDTEKETACESVIHKMYNNYQEFKDPEFLNIARDIYDYSEKTLPSENFIVLKKNLEEFKIDIR